MPASPYFRHRSGGSVLLVDADPAFRNLVGGLLQLRGFEVISAATGLEAIAKAYAKPPLDAVVLELDQFGLTPIEIVEALRLRQDQRFEAWFTTKRYRSSVWREAHAAGAAMVIKKPVNAFDLCRRIERAFVRRGERPFRASVPSDGRPNTARYAGRTLCLTSLFPSAR